MGLLRVVLVFSCVALLWLGVKCGYLSDFIHLEYNAAIYEWETITRSGVYKSGHENEYKQRFRTEIVPYHNDSIYVSIRSLTYLESTVTTVNGKKRSEELKLDVPTSKNVFEFILNDQGKIFLKKNESETATRFVKNLASYLIFDYDKYDQRKNDLKWIYNVDQPTIYGFCYMRNIATFGTDGSRIVEQTFDPRDCSNFHPTVLSDVETVKEIRGLTINNYRKYTHYKRDIGGYFLDRVETSQKIHWRPTNKKSLTHFLEINHNIIFLAAVNNTFDDTDFDFNTPLNMEISKTNNFKRDFEDDKSLQNSEFLHNQNSEALLRDIKSIMEQVAVIWKEPSVLGSDYSYFHSQELTKSIDLLCYANYEQLVILWEDFKKDTSEEGVRILNAYYRILPLVGTEGSVLFVRKLILDKDVSTEVAENMLTKLAGSIRLPSVKVLEAMKDIWSTTNTDTSLLAYYSTIGTALQDYPDTEKVKNLVNASKTIAIDIINDSLTDYKKVRLVLWALANLRCISLEDEVILDLKNKLTKTNQDLLLYMLIAFERTTPNGFLFDQMLEILQDPQYNYVIKAAAVGISLTYLPSMKHFEVLARLMDTEKNYELYNFFESAVRSLLKLHQLPDEASNWLRHREAISRSTAFVLHSLEDYPMKITVLGFLFFNDTNQAFEAAYVKVYQNFDDKPVKQYSVLLRVSGLEKFNSLSFESIMEALNKGDKINYELTLFKNDRIVSCPMDTIDTKPYIMKYLNFFDGDFNFDSVIGQFGDIFQDWHFDYYFPTDYGHHVRIYYNIPWSIATKLSLKSGIDKTDTRIHFLESFNYTAQSVHGMNLYRPEIDVQQGTRELSSLHLVEQIALIISSDRINGAIKFTIVPNDEITSLFELRTKKDTLLHFNKIGNEEIKIKDGKELLTNIDVYNKLIYINPNDQLLIHSDIGARIKARVYRYDAPVGMEEFPTTFSALMYQNPFTGFFNLGIGDWYITLLSYLNWNFLAYSAYLYNFKATMEPSDIFPIKKYHISMPKNIVNIDLLDKQDKLKVSYQFGDHGDFNQILRIGPGLESVGMCFRHTVNKPDRNVYQFFYGTKYGDLTECPMDQFHLTLETKSDFSADQIENRNSNIFSYEECLNPSIYLPARDTTNTLNCAKAATSLRDFTVNVNFKNPPKEFLTNLRQFWTWFQKTNGGIPSENNLRIIDQGDITAKFDFPLSTNKMNLEVFFSEVKYSFRNLPRIIIPDSIAFSELSEILEVFYPSTICTVVATEDLVKSTKHIYHNTTSWTLYANSVSVKKYGEEQLALKINLSTQNITVLPNESEDESEDKYVISFGEDAVDEVPRHWNNKKKIRTFRILDTVFFVSDARYETDSFVVGYNGHSVMIVSESADDFKKGRCFRK
ncbi:Vitellogenin domain-containing protein [Sergentomyia squamirostris]